MDSQDPRPPRPRAKPNSGPSSGPRGGPRTQPYTSPRDNRHASPLRVGRPTRPATPLLPASARTVAYAALTQQAERFPDMLAIELDVRALDEREAALAHAIYQIGVRRWLTIAYLVSTALGRDWHQLLPGIQGACVGAGAQIMFMDRVPAYAVLDSTVAWAKASVGIGASKMVNAGLRRLVELARASDARELRPSWRDGRDEVPLANGQSLALRAHALPEESVPRLAVATSMPRAALEAWIKEFGEDRARALAMHALVEGPTTLNLMFDADLVRTTDDRLLPHERAGHAVWRGGARELGDFLSQHPRVWVQDAAASGAVQSVRDLSPKVVLDLCAGQGTKSRQLACTFPEARIIATDTDAVRMESLQKTAAHHSNLEAWEMPRVLRELPGRVDLVLLDVPCTNTGVLARRVEARYRVGGAQLERLCALQRTILASGRQLVAPGGTVLYSTCSIDREENESQVAWASGLGLAAVSAGERTWPQGLPGDPPTVFRDGAFSARLTVRG